jgi:hypothetical protein
VCIHTLPCALQLRTLPPCRGRPQCYHMPHGSRPRLPAQEGSGATRCYTALDPTSLLRMGLVLPYVTWLWTPPPYSRGLWCYHVSHGFRACLPARAGSGATMCPTALDPASLLRTALALSRVVRPSEGHEP